MATKSSAVWAAKNLMRGAEEGEAKEDKPEPEAAADKPQPSYEDYDALRAEKRIAGTIFTARLDLTHPMCFGYTREQLALFRNFESVLPEGRDPFAAPLRYIDQPLRSGFASADNVAKIAGTPAVRAERMGSGAVIAIVDNPNFRGVWYGTNKLYANAIYFGSAIKRTGPLQSR